MAGTELIRFYDEYSTQYRELLDEVEYKVPDWLRKRVHLFANGSHVLDVGCADGTVGDVISGALSEGKVLFTGVDVSKEMVSTCAENKNYVAAYEADLASGFPVYLQDQAFDTVTAFGCLEFIPNHRELLQQVHKVWKSSLGSISRPRRGKQWPTVR